MRNKIIFGLAVFGVLAGLFFAYIYGIERKPQPPLFKPVASPYPSSIYANGIIESDQAGSSNINVYPEVPGVITKVAVAEGQSVSAGAPLIMLDDTVPKATAEQAHLQAQAALSLLNELKAQPRKETLDIAKSQVDLAAANVKLARDQFEKRRASYEIDAKSISKDVLDSAKDTLNQAEAALDVAQKQYNLTKAGAWAYDIENQQKQYDAMQQAYQGALAVLGKYVIRARTDGVVMSVNATPGSYVSGVGSYDAYTQANLPMMVMSRNQDYLAVRCYVDEILVSRLPDAAHIRAEMSLQGTDVKIPLEFVRIQPYISPKLELSNQRQEKVDLRVLPVIFRFSKKNHSAIYPGQLVDVYIGNK